MPERQHTAHVKQREDGGKRDGALPECGGAHRERDGGEAEQTQQHRLRKIGEQHAEAKTRDERERRGHERFPEEDRAERAAVHAEHAVKTEFLLAAAQKETVRIEEEERREDRDDAGAKAHHKLDGRRARAIDLAVYHIERGSGGKESDDIQYRRHERAGEKIGNIEPRIFLNAEQCELGGKACLHARSPPVCCCVSASAMRW